MIFLDFYGLFSFRNSDSGSAISFEGQVIENRALNNSPELVPL